MVKGRGGSSKSVGTGPNPNRKNGKAPKKNPKTAKKTGKTIGGYSPEKLAIRAQKRLESV